MNRIKAVMSSMFVMMLVAAAAPVLFHQEAHAGPCYYLKKYEAPEGGTVCANDGNTCMACIPKQ